MYYVKEQRKAEGIKNPNMKFGDLSREMARIWKAMGDDEKQTYTKMADQDKVRYENDMKTYTPPSLDSSDDEESDDGRKRKKKKQKKDPNAPKRPANPYMFYQKDIREQVKSEFPTLKMADLAKKIGERWNGLSQEQKQPYADKAALDKTRYEKDMEAYNAKKA